MVEQELILSFSKLDKQEQIKYIYYELQQLSELLKAFHEENGIKRMPSAIDSINTKLINPAEESLQYAYIYENLIYIRKDILTFIEKTKEI